MKKIPLTQGKWALVDDEDYEDLNQFKWYYAKAGKHGYAVRRPLGSKGKIKMHRHIMRVPADKVIDHKSGDTLDNRRSNLRICTQRENARNRVGGVPLKSGYKGAYWYFDKWVGKIRVDGKLLHLGYFDSPELAALAYNEAASKYFGEFAKLNEVKNF